MLRSAFGNTFENVASEMGLPLSTTSARLIGSQDPFSDMTAYAKAPEITAGRPSQSMNVNLSGIKFSEAIVPRDG